MRKKTVKFTADTIFWYLVYLLPVITYILYVFGTTKAGVLPNAIISFGNWLGRCGLNVWSGNIVSTSLNSIFGSGGIMPFISELGIFDFFAYFVLVYLCHILVDFILFIPRLCHKWMNKFTGGEECE